MSRDAKIMAWFLRPYAGTVALIFFLLFAFTALEAASIGAVYPLIQAALPGAAGSPEAGGRLLRLLGELAARMPGGDPVTRASVFLLVMVISAAVLGFLAESFAMWHRYKLLEDFLGKVYEKMTGNAYSYFLEKRQGELLYVGVNAAQSVGEMLMYCPKVGVELFRLASIAVLLLTISVKATLAVAALMALFAAVIHLLSAKAIHPLAVRIQKADAAVTAVFAETMAGIKQIKIFDAREQWREGYAAQVRDSRMANTWSAVWGFVPARLIMVAGAASIAASIVFVKRARPDELGAFLPVMAIYVLALQRMMPAVNNIGSYWMGLRGLGPRLETTYRTLTEDTAAVDAGRAAFPGLSRELKLEKTSFSYPTRADVLKDLELVVPKGATVAVVGESGSGKSTLADLLARLYEPTSGRVLVDGAELGSFTRASWLEKTAVVAQDTFIFHASVRDNIRLGKRDATDEQVRAAAETAFAHDFVSQLPEGYDTVVGDRGVKLSGGQRQRLAIARAILRDPDLLILDEATSALDNISEKAVQEALERAGRGRTTIVIAHRLTTVERADKIVVLSKGRIVEQGTHAELLARRGAYHDLWNKQKSEAVA